ncbi:MAG: enoyl-CoA hydratase/isomerase family protein [Castellaniella sp.]|uniref:enoyl-CoA hydratase/isomerase family protein n=1 Tax=Castellaniella sp. TaxID=1955812 RepID=UPI003C729CE8
MTTAFYEAEGEIGHVVLNRPDRLNAINGALLADLDRAFATANADPQTRAIIFRGNGRAFCSGDDLKEFDIQSQNADTIQRHIHAIQEITHRIMRSDKPVVGAVQGYAVGGGFEWMLNCDLVVAADDLVAFFPETEWGHFVTGGVTHLLPRAIGHLRAMELLMLGERQTADALHRMGLLNRVVAGPDLLDTARGLAAAICRKSAFSISRLKRTLHQDLGSELWRALDIEERITLEAFANPEADARVQKFLDTRKPRA